MKNMENKEIYEILNDYELFEDKPLLSSQGIQQNQPLCNISSSFSPRSSKFSNNMEKKKLQNERKKMLNRKAAARLRQKKKKEINELQDSNKNLKDEIEKIDCIIMKLKQQIMELEIEEK
ncbi:hypothetical protein RclHR1_11640001 [Rhizophagus clarus]|uniref:BZIP domain-containing protein n=1 Tax=Rhizophagus clarus TaxID=94130 RepID=A0A2Z6Q4K5_9GLOM|nr:hypothetical protein RclHR1_11640001 [Rhizophagus clarus]GES99288.1 hypothetical protein GLOIN_2v1775366 [Rhizophagus clarus]